MTVQDLLKLLRAVKSTGQGQWMALLPRHTRTESRCYRFPKVKRESFSTVTPGAQRTQCSERWASS